jgi:hypothetical protein
MYEYIEIPYDVKVDFLVQLNSICSKNPGYRFVTQAQKMSPVRTFSGQSKVELMLIFECLVVIEKN